MSMQQIFFCAKTPPAAIVRRVVTGLQHHGGAVLCSPDTTLLDARAQTLLCVGRGRTLQSAQGCIAVLCDDDPPAAQVLAQCSIGIALSCHTNTLAALQQATLPTVTCSGVRATLCLSACADDGQAQLCLQRSLRNAAGELLEPFEFTLDKQGCTEEELLLAAAVLLLLGAV